MRKWQLLAAGLAVLAIAALVFLLVLTQNRLRAAQSELVPATESKTKLESVVASLRTGLDLASKARDESEANLKQADSQIQKLKTELSDTQSQLNEATTQNARLLPQLQEAKRALEQAKSRPDASAKEISDLKNKADLVASA